MSAYQQLLQLARQQSAAVARGDVEAAVALLAERAALLDGAGPPSPADAEAIREVLRRDRDLSGAIRERMLSIRARSLELQQGRTALHGYAPRAHRRLGLVDTRR